MPRRAQLADELAHGSDADYIESVGWFVQDDVLRTMNDGACDGDFHAFALRESMDASIGDSSEVQEGDELVYSLLKFIFSKPVQSSVIGNVFTRAQSWVKSTTIGQDAQSFAAFDEMFMDVDAIDNGISALGLNEAAENSKGGGFASAIVTEQTGDRTVVTLETQVIDCDNVAETLVDVFQFNHQGDGPA